MLVTFNAALRVELPLQKVTPYAEAQRTSGQFNPRGGVLQRNVGVLIVPAAETRPPRRLGGEPQE